jgi:hypothetical protein
VAQGQPARRNCGAMIEHRRLLNEDPSYVSARAGIETRARAYELGLARSARAGLTRIPVVVHVVWNTAAQNISDAQIQSQINVLNRQPRHRAGAGRLAVPKRRCENLVLLGDNGSQRKPDKRHHTHPDPGYVVPPSRKSCQIRSARRSCSLAC